jgi:CDP-glucose 4,6-dehydratase
MEELVTKMNSSFEGKRILVTGHTGFKGSWLVAALKHLGAEVIGISNEESKSQFYLLNESLRPDIEYFNDIRDRSHLQEIFMEEKFHGIFHLAAQALVLDSFDNPLKTFEINTLGTMNILDIASKYQEILFVFIASTDKVYANMETGNPFSEQDALGPGPDPYSSSKFCMEVMISSWTKTVPSNFSKRILIGRAGNVIGGGDNSANRLIPDLVRSTESKKTLLIRNPDSVRPWQHVLDPIFGYLLFANKLIRNQSTPLIMNFGPPSNSNRTVMDMIEIASKFVPNLVTRLGTSDAKNESKFLSLNSDLAKKELDWETSISAENAIEMTLMWQKAAEECRSEEISQQQITQYFLGKEHNFTTSD